MVIRALINEAEPKRDLGKVDEIWLQTWMHANAAWSRGRRLSLPAAAKREIAQLGQLQMEDVIPQHRFLLVRAAPDHPDQWLTNRLIAHLVPPISCPALSSTSRGFMRPMSITAKSSGNMLWPR